MDELIINKYKKNIWIKNKENYISFSQFDDSKLNNKSSEINIDKTEIKNVIDTLKQMIK